MTLIKRIITDKNQCKSVKSVLLVFYLSYLLFCNLNQIFLLKPYIMTSFKTKKLRGFIYSIHVY